MRNSFDRSIPSEKDSTEGLPPLEASTDSSRGLLSVDVTSAHDGVGTPAYMAPERLL